MEDENKPPLNLLLYTTLGCHLCEQAKLCLDQITEIDYELSEIEISETDALMKKYQVRIPVLGIEDSDKELDWPFTEAGIRKFLNVFS